MPLSLYLDEHFGSGIATQLAQQGAELGLQVEAFAVRQPRGSDPAQLHFAATQGWTILTRDRDFVHLHDLWFVLRTWRPLTPPLRHAGILYIESSSVLDDDAVPSVVEFLARPDRPPLEDQLYVLATGGTWLSHHPFSETLRRRLVR
ncbi:MAG: DUF5615 family PIN-like protein [Chloroflexota bacterium]|nr:DUF5615 family PIN-like protein [Chloroflexota bacterium]